MLPVRLLALTIYGYLAPVLRKPLRPQPHRYHHHQQHHHHHHQNVLSTSTSPARNSAALASRGLNLPSAFIRMASTSYQHNDRRHHESVEVAGEEAEASVDLDLDTAAGVYRYLRGHWELEKSINYKVGGMAGSWRGVASFSPPLPLPSPPLPPPPPPPQQQQQQQQQRQHGQRQQQQHHQQQHEAGTGNPSTSERTAEGENNAAPEEQTAGVAGAGAALAADDGEIMEDPSLLLRYLEQGTFRINGLGAGFEAGQRLVYDCGNSSGRVRVHFVDDPKQPNALRFFHELDFRKPGTEIAAAAAGVPGRAEAKGEGDGCSSGGGRETAAAAAAAAVDIGMHRPRAEFEHLCVRDMYRGQVEVVGPDEFKTRWHVTGPSKDGKIHATYRRKSSGSQEGQHEGGGGRR